LGLLGFPAWRPWVLREVGSRASIRVAVEAGINIIDA